MPRKHIRLECPEEGVKYLTLPSPEQCRLHRRIGLASLHFPTNLAFLADFGGYCQADLHHPQERGDCYLEFQTP